MPCSLSRLVLVLGLALHAPAAMAETQAVDSAAEAAVSPAPADPGAYLAARSAEAHGDFRTAAAWFAQAFAADPGNAAIRNGLLLADLCMGEIDAAASVAAQAGDGGRKGGRGEPLVDVALLAGAALHDDYDGLARLLEEGRSAGPLFDKLALGWARVGQGRMADALALFDQVAKTRGFEGYGLYHKALALAMAGDFEGANHILSGEAVGPLKLNLRGVVASVQVLSQLEKKAEALKLIDDALGVAPNPVADDLRAQLKAGAPVVFDSARNARDGLAEVFFTLATLLNDGADPAFALMNARAAVALRPDHTEAKLLVASTLEALQQHDLAAEVYAAFTPDDPAYYSAEIGRANALQAAGSTEAAIEALRGLARAYPDLLVAQSALGDMLRQNERWGDALAAYDAALALVPRPQQIHWPLFFSRGICNERLGRYDASDADFRKALELNPGQPQVLNYLGYSLIERRKNLDEAFALIRQAVTAQPDAGYIVDSLAWAYFTLGRYAEALEPMERASLLEPVDPTVTDHLGDVYWMNGRKREAEFQWRRALSFNPEEKDAARIRRKLEVGLDAVMKAEGAQAPSAPQAGANGE